MKKVLLGLVAAAAVLVTSVANAAVYQLTSIEYRNSFITAAPGYLLVGSTLLGSIDSTSTATTNAGAVSVSNLSWSVGPQNGIEYTASNWAFTTNVGANQSIIKSSESNVCVSGTFCQIGTKSGFGGNLFSGTPAALDVVTVTEAAGVLTIKIQRGLDNTTAGFTASKSQSYSFIYSEVPVPAAAWLMGSGLVGLAGIARRRK